MIQLQFIKYYWYCSTHFIFIGHEVNIYFIEYYYNQLNVPKLDRHFQIIVMHQWFSFCIGSAISMQKKIAHAAETWNWIGLAIAPCRRYSQLERHKMGTSSWHCASPGHWDSCSRAVGIYTRVLKSLCQCCSWSLLALDLAQTITHHAQAHTAHNAQQKILILNLEQMGTLWMCTF